MRTSLTPREIAERESVSVGTVYKWIKRGLLPVEDKLGPKRIPANYREFAKAETRRRELVSTREEINRHFETARILALERLGRLR